MKDRLSLYKDLRVQLLLNKFVKGEITELAPTFDGGHHTRYLEVEQIVDGDLDSATELVEELCYAGILRRKFFEKIIVCPSCSSANVSVDYACPNCNSLDIDRKNLLEHTACKNIDSVDNFQVEGRLVCQKCGKNLDQDGLNYQNLGSWFQCSQCGKRSVTPYPIHKCRKCRHVFTIKDTGFLTVYAYSLNANAGEEFRNNYPIMKPIKTALEESQFKVQTPGRLVGRSGVLHRFDAVATKGGSQVVLDVIAGDRQIDEVPVVSFYAKIFDVASARAILVAIPNLAERARKVATLYRISMIEASNSEEAAEKLRAKLGWAGLTPSDESMHDLQV